MSVPPPRNRLAVMAVVAVLLALPLAAAVYLRTFHVPDNCVFDPLSYHETDDFNACQARSAYALGPPSWAKFGIVVGGTVVWAVTLRLVLLHYWFSESFRAWLWERRRAKRYRLDENRGEWERITKRGRGGNVIVTTKPRGTRLVDEHHAFDNKIGFSLFVWLWPAVQLGMAVNYFTDTIFFWFLSLSWILPIVWGWQLIETRNKTLVIDPPAVRPDMKPYGDDTPFRTPAVSAGSDETDYEFPEDGMSGTLVAPPGWKPRGNGENP